LLYSSGRLASVGRIKIRKNYWIKIKLYYVFQVLYVDDGGERKENPYLLKLAIKFNIWRDF
jgi:hypothetical protein